MLGRLAMWAIPVVVGAVALAVYLTSGRFSSTDNAYVKGERVQVAAEVSGPIVAISIVENQRVRRGDKLLQIDPRPYEIVLARSQAEMQAARSEILSLKVAYRQKQEEIKSAGSQLAYAQAENLRQSELAQRKVASQQRAEEAKRDLDIASQRVAMLNEELARVVVALFGDPDVPLEQHPRVRGAMAARDEAQLNLARTRVLAPIDGIVSRKPTIGAYAAAGSPLLAVVADEGLWVEANFKETDLTRVRPGQTVTIRIDTYPDHVWYGTVGSISQATGAEFALLPPQNASGNWVKVVQRIPVRIDVPQRASDPPLRLGMSATVDIDTGHQRSLGDVWQGIARALGGDAAAGTPQAAKR